MANLPTEVFDDVVETLSPHLGTISSRQTELYPLLSSKPVYRNIQWEGDAREFTVRLTQLLSISDLVHLLQRLSVGEEQKPRIELLCGRLIGEQWSGTDQQVQKQALDEDKSRTLYDPEQTFSANPIATIISTDAEIDVQDKTLSNKRLLIIAVSPINTERLRLDKEVREISNILRSSKHHQFHIEARWAVRLRDLRQALLDFEPDIIHFCGHGDPEHGIILEGEDGLAQPVEPSDLAELFSILSLRTESLFAIFNSCYSTSQADALMPYIEFVIGMDSLIEDSAAIEFASAFYQTLAAGKDVEVAYNIARHALRNHPSGSDVNVLIRKSTSRPSIQPKMSTDSDGYSYGKRSRKSSKVLLMTSNPIDTEYLRLDKEVREIYSALLGVQNRKDYWVEQRWGTRFKDFSLALIEVRPHIIHFSGHGTPDGIILEDDSGKAQLVTNEIIVSTIELLKDRMECVVFNSPYSDVLAKAVSRVVRYGIGLPDSVTDVGAILFASGFYRSLAARRPVRDAYKLGCLEIKNELSSSAEVPCLYEQGTVV